MGIFLIVVCLLAFLASEYRELLCYLLATGTWESQGVNKYRKGKIQKCDLRIASVFAIFILIRVLQLEIHIEHSNMYMARNTSSQL